MSYTALYRKWRPATFDEVKGQDHIVKTLKNQIASERIGHAYLFCGTRGTGKTSIAKIFAKAVNCEHPADGSPCGECAMCRQIGEGSSLNVVEIDAASNNGVENIRDIREQVQYPPTEGRYRVYIIDEVHMLSIGAFNALLKTLEEPPSYVIFILATTEVHKIPITILSRCQRYDFKRITIDTITERLKELTEAERIDAQERALRYVAKAADGSMRDALSLLDQCTAFHFGEVLTYESVLEVLGAVDTGVFSRLFCAVVGEKTADCIYLVDELIVQGRELSQFVTDFIWYLRNLMLLGAADDAEQMLDVSEENLKQLKEEAAMTDAETLMRYIRIFSELSGQLRFASQKRVLVETALIKLTKPAMEQNLDSVLQRLNQIEKRLEGIPEDFSQLAALAVADQAAGGAPAPGASAVGAGRGNAAGGAPAGAVGQTAAGGSGGETKTVTLPRAQYEDLMLIRGEWNKICSRIGSALTPMLKDTRVEPAGDGCLCIVFTNAIHCEFVSRGSALAEIRDFVEKTCGKALDFKTHLDDTGRAVSPNYEVSDEDVENAIHTEVITEDVPESEEFF